MQTTHTAKTKQNITNVNRSKIMYVNNKNNKNMSI